MPYANDDVAVNLFYGPEFFVKFLLHVVKLSL
jgi:hypothetical protein